jgi:WD40 repeat protein
VRVKWLLTEALRALDSMAVSVETRRVWPSEPNLLTYTVSPSPDDAELVSGHDTGVAFWDASTGALRRRMAMRCCSAIVRYDHSGDRLLTFGSGGGDAPTRIIEIGTGRELASVPVGADVDYAVWSSDGSTLATVNHDGRVDVWKAGLSATRVLSISGVPTPVFGSLALSRDGSLLAARGKSEIILASPATGRVRRLPVPGDDVQQLSLSFDGRSLLTTMADRSIRIWDVATGLQRDKLPAHSGPPTVALFSPDGSMIASGGATSLNIWDASSTVSLARFDVELMSGAFAHHRSRLVTSSLDGQIRVWDLSRERWARPLPGHRGGVRALYLAGGERILTADVGEDGRGRVRTWNAASGLLETSIALDLDLECDLAVAADGNRVALHGRDRRIRILDTSSAKVQNVQLVIEAGEPVRDLGFSPDGQVLAGISQKGVVKLWSTVDGAVVRDIPMDNQTTEAIRSAAVEFSPDGRHLLTAGDDVPARVWDTSSWKLLRELPQSRSADACYSADGRRIITGGMREDEVPRVWDAATGATVAELGVHGHVVQSVALSHDGALASTLDGDGTTRIWDATTGAELRTIDGPTDATLPTYDTGWSRTIRFSPDKKHLLAASTSYALIWNIELDTRPPSAVDQLVAAKSPWRLIDGRLTQRPREP